MLLSSLSLLFSLVPALLLLLTSAAPFLVSYHGVSIFHGHQTKFETSDEHNGVSLDLSYWRIRTKGRLLGDNSSTTEQVNSTTMVLAAKRTRRVDPLNHFRTYIGGWNISNRHYWASVGYTAVPFFAVAAVWFVFFGICLISICLYFCCCRREPYGYSRIAYALSLILLVFFTIAAIIGCVVLYTGQGKYHTSTMKTLEFIVHQANTTSESLKNVSGYLAAAKQVNVDQMFLPSNVQGDIDRIQNKINTSSTALSTKTEDNSERIKNLIKSVRVALIILSAVMLLLTFLGFVFSLFGRQIFVYILVILGWILVTGTFILCGVFLLLHNVTGDTCVAMDQWVQNPTAHTTLDDILPCVDNATAQDTLDKSKEVTSQLVNIINTVITNISNNNFAPSFVPFYYNQSGPPVPKLCNPFNPDRSYRACSSGEVELSNGMQVWKRYVCESSSTSGMCVTTGRLTRNMYNQMGAGLNVSYGLYRYGPFLVSLEDCTFARQTFSDINANYCHGLRKYSQWIYIGLLMVAIAVMLSLLFWVIYGRERRHRVYTKAGLDGDKHEIQEAK